MFALIDPRIWAAFAVSMACAFGVGYGYKAHRVSLEQAATTATVETAQSVVTKTVKVTDKAAVDRLNAQLADMRDRADALETIINEARHASPIPAADCRLPDSVRTAINADLAPSSK